MVNGYVFGGVTDLDFYDSTINFDLLMGIPNVTAPANYTRMPINSYMSFSEPNVNVMALVFGDRVVGLSQPLPHWRLEKLHNRLKNRCFNESMFVNELPYEDITVPTLEKIAYRLSQKVGVLAREYDNRLIERHVAAGVPSYDALVASLRHELDVELLTALYSG